MGYRQAAEIVSARRPDWADRLRALERAQDTPLPGRSSVRVVGRPHSGRTTLVGELARLGVPVSEAEPGAHEEIAVVVVVFDAASPIGATDLEAVRGMTATVDEVLFAIARTDAHRGWRAVRDRNAELLAAGSARFRGATIHPVSSRLTARSREVRSADAAAADTLLHACGLPELRGLVHQATERPGAEIRDRNRARTIDSALAAAMTSTRVQIADIRRGDDLRQLHEHRAELSRGRDQGRVEAISMLRSDCQLAKVELLHQCAEDVRGAARRSRAEIDNAGPRQLRALPSVVIATAGELEADTSARVTARLQRITERLRGRCDFSWDEHAWDGQPDALSVSEPLAPPPARPGGVENTMIVLVGASGGVGLGRLLVSPLSVTPALEIAAVPVTLLLGTAIAWWMVRARRHLADRAHLRQWLTDGLSTVQSRLERIVLARILDAESRLGAALSRAHGERTRRRDVELGQVESSLRALTSDRSVRLQRAQQELAELESHRRRLR